MPLHINGREYTPTSEQLSWTLLDYLREAIDLTGTKCGCNAGFCGTCMVLVDKRAVQSCTVTVAAVIDKTVVTIEGIANSDGSLHPLQQAFIDAGAVQCGFCIPGMILSSHALLLQNAQPSREQIRKAIDRNLCRCTGYQQIVDAVEQAAPFYRH